MSYFDDTGVVAVTTGGGTNDDSGIARIITPGRKVQIRRVRFNFSDPGFGGGWGRVRIVVTEGVIPPGTGAVLAQWSTAINSPATHAYGNFNGDIRMDFETGTTGVVITVTIESENAGANGAVSISGRLR